MKILALEYGHRCASVDEAMVCYPDSTLIRNNDDFYIPNFSQKIVAYVGIYLQFSKIGKCIEPQFVFRYFQECGVAIKFMAADVIERNAPYGTATDIACSFDSSLAISNEKLLWNPLMNFVAMKNGENILFSKQNIDNISQLISIATHYYTVKIGDLFFVPLIEMPILVAKNDTFDVSLQGKQLLTCTIK